MMHVVRVSTRFGSVAELMDALAELRAKRSGLFIQAFDGKAVVSERHLLLAYENAKLALAEKRNFAERLEAEMLARAAGTRKIKDAIARIGARDAKNAVVMFEGIGKTEVLGALGAKELKPVFVAEKAEVAKRFGIPARMLSAYPLEKCVLEKVAMADVE